MKHHKSFYVAFLSLGLLVAAPTSLVFAQDAGWLNGFSDAVLGLIGTLVPILVSIALLVFIWGVVVFIAKSGDEQAVIEGRKKMIWGVVALFVIVSVWGLVALIQQVTNVGSEQPISPSAAVGDGSDSGYVGTSGSGTSPNPGGGDDPIGPPPSNGGDDDDPPPIPPPPAPGGPS